MKNILVVVDRPPAVRAGSVGGSRWSDSGKTGSFELVSFSIFELVSFSIFELVSFSKFPNLASLYLQV